MNPLKNVLIFPLVLALPNTTCHMTFDTNACDVHIGCNLQQQQPNSTTKSIGYRSRSLINAERKYNTMQGESFAIFCAVLLLRAYLGGTRITFHTDDSLKWILSLTDITGRLARWRLWLFKSDFDVEHRAGLRRQAVDTLFRVETTNGDNAPLRDNLSLLTYDAKSDDNSKLVINDNRDDTIPLNLHEKTSIDALQY